MLKVHETKTRDTNALVETWFRIVKVDILAKEKNLRLADFIRTMKVELGRRFKEHRTFLAQMLRRRAEERKKKATQKKDDSTFNPQLHVPE